MLASPDWLPPEPPPFQPQRDPVPLWREPETIGAFIIVGLLMALGAWLGLR